MTAATTTAARRAARRPKRRKTLASAAVLALLALPASLPAASAQNSAAGAGVAAEFGPTADALFDALDLDRDGLLSKRDVRDGLERIGLALGMDFDVLEAAAAVGRGEAAEVGGGGGGGIQRKAKDLAPDLGGAPPHRPQAGAGAPGLPGAAERLSVPPPKGAAAAEAQAAKRKEKLSFWKAFTSSVAMILATEIGDKTFFIAAVLSMRNARSAVFGGAILALVIMTILSTMMGLVLPSFLPRRYTHIIGGLLFLYFGVRLVSESRGMEEDKVSDELEEVEEELLRTRKKDYGVDRGKGGNNKKEKDEEADIVESGNRRGGSNSAPSSGAPSSGNLRKQESGMSSAAGYSSASWEKVFLQSLTLTFLAEWGDRSQIATIALAAAKDPWGVTAGGCLGHSMCTGMAVVGGRMLASRISEKTVTFWGGWVFLAFGVHSLFFET